MLLVIRKGTLRRAGPRQSDLVALDTDALRSPLDATRARSVRSTGSHAPCSVERGPAGTSAANPAPPVPRLCSRLCRPISALMKPSPPRSVILPVSRPRAAGRKQRRVLCPSEFIWNPCRSKFVVRHSHQRSTRTLCCATLAVSCGSRQRVLS